jgi:hypothetical protein
MPFLRAPPPYILAATAAAVFAWAPCDAYAQSDGSDLLTPLVPPSDDDLLTPLVPPNDDDLLEPLVPPDNDDLLEPLVPPNNDDLLEPLVKKPRKPGKVTHKDEIELGPVANGFMLVKRKVVDPCGVFEVSWGGRKTCHATEREKWEYVAVGSGAGDDDSGPDDEASADGKDEGRSPGGGWPGPGPGGSGPGPSGNGPGPGGNGPGPGPGPGPKGSGPARPGSNGGAPAKGGAVVVVPAPDGFARLRDVSVRLDSFTVDPQGRFDIVLTLRNFDATSKPVAAGDWTVTLTDAAGHSVDTRDIWMPGQAATTPFPQMPNIGPGATQRLRFVLARGILRARLVGLSVQQNGAPPVLFDISANAAARATAQVAPEPEW